MPADLLITNARIFTATSGPTAEALAVRGSRIVFVGSAAGAHAWRDPKTRLIDAGGRTLMPGFIDSHFHLLWGSLELCAAQLGEVRTLDDLGQVLLAYADDHPDQEWVHGQGLIYLTPPSISPLPLGMGDPTPLREGVRGLTRHHLDAIIAHRPVAVTAYDGHTVWANTLALKKAGILHGGVVGPGSEIVMGADGRATGELRERGASHYVDDLIPEPTEPEKRALLHRGLKLAASLGITSVHNMDGEMEQLTRYMALEDTGELTLRIYVPYTIRPETPIEALSEAVEMAQANPGEMARGGAVKFFMDGVIESYTALMLDDYTGAPGNKGSALFTAEHFTRMATEADRLGLQIFVHAIGDAAVRRTLDGYESARRTNGKRDSRHRVEHIEVVHPDDLPRFAGLGVIASMQPLHAPLSVSGYDLWPSRVGVERWDRSFAWNLVRNAGAKLVFGSDWPVVSQSPIRGLHAALNRQPWQEGLANHRQTLEQALLAYTRDAAYAEFKEHEKGMLKPGYLADLVLLSEDIFEVPPEEIERVHPEMTMVDGRVVFEK
ncbi:MAG TPA: amidohydrolase [Anaerolineales bacterium]|nr:amidohydrolase [Anaerolineales bacterium]